MPPPPPPPLPTPVLRFVHVDNLDLLLRRGALHAPNHTPQDGLVYRTIHSVAVQQSRHQRRVPCGPRGVIHDYVPFYFGPLSPMLLNLHTGRVPGYTEGQDPLIYLVTEAQAVAQQRPFFVFTDGHGLAAFTRWFDSLAQLTQVDWPLVQARYWADTLQDGDRQRRKQAEFLVHQSMPWDLVREVVVRTNAIEQRVRHELSRYPQLHRPPVFVQPGWYY